MIQVNVPTDKAGQAKLKIVGGQDGGAMPRLDLMDIPTPSATMMSPRVEMPYLTRIFCTFIKSD